MWDGCVHRRAAKDPRGRGAGSAWRAPDRRAAAGGGGGYVEQHKDVGRFLEQWEGTGSARGLGPSAGGCRPVPVALRSQQVELHARHSQVACGKQEPDGCWMYWRNSRSFVGRDGTRSPSVAAAAAVG